MAEVAKSDRRQALDLAIASIDRQFGKGAIMRLGQGGVFDEISVIPTGALSLDVALGIGGIPRGRVTEIYGPESSGKTTLTLHAIASIQKQGGTAAFIDAERDVEGQRPRGNDGDLVEYPALPQAHDGALAELPVDGRDRQIEGLPPIALRHFSHGFSSEARERPIRRAD